MSLFGPSFMHANMGSRRGLMAPAPIVQMGFTFKIATLNLTDTQIRALSSAAPITLVAAVPGSVLFPAWLAYAANITAGFSAARLMSLRWTGAGFNLLAGGSNQYSDTVIRVNEWVAPVSTGTGLLLTAQMANRAIEAVGSGAVITGGSTQFGGRLRMGYYVIPLSDTL